MAYENLKNAIRQVIKQNGNQEITGNLLQSTLLNMVDNIPEVVQELGSDKNKVISQKAVSSKLDNLAFESKEIKKELPNKANTSDVQTSLEELKKEIGDRTIVEGSVTNLPDEEDITSGINESGIHVLSFKDRVYNPLSFSGKGYKILRKNIKPVSLAVTKIIVESIPTVDGTIVFTINGVEVSVDTVTTTMTSTDLVAQKIAEKLTETMTEYEVSKDASMITLTRKFGGSVAPSVFSASTTGVVCTITDSTKQELRNIITPIMMNQPNTTYVIRYDFDLNGEIIEIEKGCTLMFKGGSLNNGTIDVSHAFIDYVDGKINCNVIGNIKVIPKMFGGNDDVALNFACELCRKNGLVLNLEPYIYKIKNSIDASAIKINGNGATIYTESPLEYALISNKYKIGCYIKDITIDCNNITKTGYYISDANGYKVINCIIKDFIGYGIFCIGGASIIYDNFLISASSNCERYCRGIYSEKPDCEYVNGEIKFTPIAIDTVGGNFINLHIWGIPSYKNVNIGILQRHTNIQVTNCEFDSIVSYDNTNVSPSKIIRDGKNYEQVFHGGAAILSLMDNVTLISNKCTNNQTVDWSAYNTPIYLCMTDNNYYFVDIGRLVNFGLKIIPYSVPDNVLFKSTIIGPSPKKVDSILKESKSYIGDIKEDNSQLNVFGNSSWLRLGNIKAKLNNKVLYKLCDINKADSWTRHFISIKILDTFVGNFINLDISFYKKENDMDIDYRFYNSALDKAYLLKKDNSIYIYFDYSYYSYFMAEISLSDTQVSFEGTGEIVGSIDEYEKINAKCVSSIAIGTSDDKPQNVEEGFLFYNKSLKKPICFDGLKWIDLLGNSADAKKQGISTERPSNVQIGYIYKDTTLNKLIIWDGAAWVNLDGTALT